MTGAAPTQRDALRIKAVVPCNGRWRGTQCHTRDREGALVAGVAIRLSLASPLRPCRRTAALQSAQFCPVERDCVLRTAPWSPFSHSSASLIPCRKIDTVLCGVILSAVCRGLSQATVSQSRGSETGATGVEYTH